MRKQSRMECLRFESLEPRLMMSGNVLASLSPAGDLVLRGDRLDNFVVIEQTDQGVTVSGVEGTTINGLPSVDFVPSLRDVSIHLRGGDDRVDIMGLEVSRNLRINGGAGDDRVHLFDAAVGGDLLGRAGRGTDLFTQDLSEITGRLRLNQFEVEQIDVGGAISLLAGATNAQNGQNVMEIKLNQAIQTLTRTKQPEDAYIQAINETMEAIYTSNLVVLPTFNNNTMQPDNDTQQAFNEHLQMAQDAIDALNRHVGIGTPGSREAAAEARNFIQITMEAMEVIGEHTRQANPQNPNDPLLQADDEGGTIVDNVLGGIFARQVRSPFPAFLFPAALNAQEQVIVPPGPIGPDEIAIVVKEIQGIKVVVTARVVPIWVEPWFARATIVGVKTVWTWEFVPAEFIKTISFANVAVDPQDPDAGRRIDVDVQTHMILERELLHFWRFAQKEITSVPG